jgi:hypothetical protein
MGVRVMLPAREWRISTTKSHLVDLGEVVEAVHFAINTAASVQEG